MFLHVLDRPLLACCLTEYAVDSITRKPQGALNKSTKFTISQKNITKQVEPERQQNLTCRAGRVGAVLGKHDSLNVTFLKECQRICSREKSDSN